MSFLQMKRKVGRYKAKQGEPIEDPKRKKNAGSSYQLVTDGTLTHEGLETIKSSLKTKSALAYPFHLACTNTYPELSPGGDLPEQGIMHSSKSITRTLLPSSI
jgi:hypothetical protein